MPQTVMANYHVHSPRRQAFHIDAGGVVGTVVSPELGETEVPLRNLHGPESDLTFARDGVAFISAPTRVRSFATVQEWQTDYDAELTALLTRGVGTKEVAVFNITTIRACRWMGAVPSIGWRTPASFRSARASKAAHRVGFEMTSQGL